MNETQALHSGSCSARASIAASVALMMDGKITARRTHSGNSAKMLFHSTNPQQRCWTTFFKQNNVTMFSIWGFYLTLIIGTVEINEIKLSDPTMKSKHTGGWRRDINAENVIEGELHWLVLLLCGLLGGQRVSSETAVRTKKTNQEKMMNGHCLCFPCRSSLKTWFNSIHQTHQYSATFWTSYSTLPLESSIRWARSRRFPSASMLQK